MARHTADLVPNTGLNATYNVVTNGDTIGDNDGKLIALVKNGGGASINFTITSSSTWCPSGVAHNLVVAVPAASERFITIPPPARVGAEAAISAGGAATTTMALLRLVSQ